MAEYISIEKYMAKIKFAPREIFETILEWAVMPTFDLVIEYGKQGVVLVKRKIVPYKDQWALPGLRMYKGENIDDTLKRIAMQELGLKINSSKRIFLGQFAGKFKTEHNRQDLSTGYWIRADEKKIELNKEHFSGIKIIKKLPAGLPAMYKFYLKQYFNLRKEI